MAELGVYDRFSKEFRQDEDGLTFQDCNDLHLRRRYLRCIAAVAWRFRWNKSHLDRWKIPIMYLYSFKHMHEI